MDEQAQQDRITALQNAADWNAAMAEQCEHEQRHADAGRH